LNSLPSSKKRIVRTWLDAGFDVPPMAIAKAINELAGARFQVQLCDADMLAS